MFRRYGGRKGIVSEVEARCRLPHRLFSPTACVTTDYRLLANPVVKLFEGHSLRWFAHSAGPVDTVETVAVVKFAAGDTRVVNYSIYEGPLPLSLRPVFVYPDPTAVEAHLQAMGSDGKLREVTLPLTPCGDMACYVDPQLRPVALNEAAPGREFNIPAPIGDTVEYEGYVLSAAMENMSAAIDILPCGSRVNALVELPRSSAGLWATGSHKFIAAGASGLRIFSIDGRGGFSPALIVDRRPVESPAAVVEASVIGSVPRLFILAGNDLVEAVDNRIITVRRRVDASMLAWNSPYGELCIVKAGISAADVMDISSRSMFRRTLGPVSHILNACGHSRLTVRGSGYLSMDREIPADSRISAVWNMELTKVKPRVIAPGCSVTLEIDIDSSALSGDIDISASRGISGLDRPEQLSRLELSGPVNAPLLYTLLMPSRRHLRLTLDALASPDTTLRPPLLAPNP